MERAESVLTLDEIGRMIDLGLGRGVDATSPTPWLNKSAFQVREVTSHNIIGTDEGSMLQSYSHEVSSVQVMQTNMSASVPVSQQVSVGIDAELSRNYSTSRRSVGKKIITRSISYRADFDDLTRRKSSVEYVMPGPPLYDSAGTPQRRASNPRQQSFTSERTSSFGSSSQRANSLAATLSSDDTPVPTFEQRLARWIIERLLEEEVDGLEELGPADDPVDVLATFIAEWPGEVAKVKQLVGKKCREFINHFCITHYVSCIQLGAAKYRVMSEEEYQTQVGVKGNVGVEKLASVAVEQRMSFGRRSRSDEVTKIGQFSEGGKVARGTTDEAVVGVKFQPISALVRTRILRNKLQNAIKSYIDNQEHSKGMGNVGWYCAMSISLSLPIPLIPPSPLSLPFLFTLP